jgi:hypothetical protein
MYSYTVHTTEQRRGEREMDGRHGERKPILRIDIVYAVVVEGRGGRNYDADK